MASVKRNAKEPGAAMTFVPATGERWQDLETLFGEKGACGGCWCMYWRLPAKEFREKKGAANKRALRALLQEGDAPGILAYHGDEPVGWCAVAPREVYVKLGTAKSLRPVDDQPAWSITCLFVTKTMRKKGVSVELLKAAARFVKVRGGKLVEGYPVQAADGGTMPAVFAWTGTVAAFRQAGFQEVARPSPTRAIMRLKVG